MTGECGVKRAMCIGGVGLVAILAPVMASAALAPNYQRLREMNAILDSPAVQKTFDIRRPLEGLQFVSPDLYAATGGGCRLMLRVVGGALPAGMVGPRPFRIEAGELTCK